MYRRQFVVAQTQVALRRSGGPRGSRNWDFGCSDGLQAVVGGLKPAAPLIRVQGKRIRPLLLRQRLGGLAKIRFRHFADLKTPRPSDLANDRTGIFLHRHFVLLDESQRMLADDGLFHLFFAATLREAGPLQGERAAQADQVFLDRNEDRREAEARRQKNADQQHRAEQNPRAATIQIRDRRLIDFLPEVSARCDQRAAKPDLAERQIEQRRNGDQQRHPSEGLGLHVFDKVWL